MNCKELISDLEQSVSLAVQSTGVSDSFCCTQGVTPLFAAHCNDLQPEYKNKCTPMHKKKKKKSYYYNFSFFLP